MALLAFTLLFVSLGLGVLFVALSGGPGGARKRMASQSRRTRRIALFNFLLAVVILGLGVPAAVIATVDSRNDVPEANVSNLTAAEKRGRELFGQRCANCHTLKASKSVAQVGPDLDVRRPPKALVLNAIHNGRAQGNGQMAADLVEGQDADDVAAYVAKAVGQTTEK
jgi:mono/diheme cytochrome c family protein